MNLETTRAQLGFWILATLLAIGATGCGLLLDLQNADAEAGLDAEVPTDASAPDPTDPLPATCTEDAECDDDRYCTGIELCVGGRCVHRNQPMCDDGVECTADGCNEDLDACVHRPRRELCGSGEVCFPNNGCGPGRPCQRDEECDDGAFCSGEEMCLDGLCQPGLPVACPSSGCLEGICDEAKDECATEPSDAFCDDGLSCTVDACRASTGECSHLRLSNRCDDGFGCTNDGCSPEHPLADGATGCIHTPDDSVCNGSDDSCFELVCASAPGSATGCAPQFKPDFCSSDEICDSTTGACEPGSEACTNDGDCDDGNPCNGIEKCTAERQCETEFASCPPPMDSCFDSYCDLSSGAPMCEERPTLICFEAL